MKTVCRRIPDPDAIDRIADRVLARLEYQALPCVRRGAWDRLLVDVAPDLLGDAVRLLMEVVAAPKVCEVVRDQ